MRFLKMPTNPKFGIKAKKKTLAKVRGGGNHRLHRGVRKCIQIRLASFLRKLYEQLAEPPVITRGFKDIA